jgi:hypothetical protein
VQKIKAHGLFKDFYPQHPASTLLVAEASCKPGKAVEIFVCIFIPPKHSNSLITNALGVVSLPGTIA